MRSRLSALLSRFARDAAGSMVVETAIIVPALAAMALAGVEVSTMIVRQHELQSIASNAAEIIIAAEPASTAEEDEMVASVRAWAGAATGLTPVSIITGPNQVAVARVIRCGNSSQLKQKSLGCESGQNVAVYVRIRMVETYDPFWGTLGIGDNTRFKVERSIRIG